MKPVMWPVMRHLTMSDRCSYWTLSPQNWRSEHHGGSLEQELWIDIWGPQDNFEIWWFIGPQDS
jgi:hypothetical protein